MRRILVLMVVSLLAVPVAANADPVTNVVLDAGTNRWLCVEAGASPSVMLTLTDPLTHKTIDSVTPAASTTLCSGAAGTSFSTGFGDQYVDGAQVTITPAGGGAAVTVPVPYGVHTSTDFGATAIAKFANLPDPGVITVAASPPAATTGGRYTTPAALPSPAFTTNVTAIIGGASYSATFSTRAGSFSAGSNTVSVGGADPLGPPIVVTVASAGQTATVTLNPTVGVNAGSLNAHLPFVIADGATVTVNQPGWYTHAATAPTASVSPIGFAAAVPSGARGFYYFSGALFDPSAARPAADPLNCNALGSSAFITGYCGVSVPDRFSVNITGLNLAAGDQLTVDETTASLDSFGIGHREPGFFGNLDGNNGELFSDVPVNGPVNVHIVRPAGGGYAAAKETIRASLSPQGVFFGQDQSRVFRFTPGTAVTLTGPGFATQHAVYNLNASLTGSQVGGSAPPNDRIRVRQSAQNGSTFYFFTTAAANGQFSVPLNDPLPNDFVIVNAVDTTTGTNLRQGLVFGAPALRIAGLQDGQLVRGVIRLTAPTTPAGADVRWSGDFGVAAMTSPPFGFTIDTRRVDDGPAYVRASAATHDDVFSPTDWVDVIVDNTPPRGSLPRITFGLRGRLVQLDPDQTDANGIGKIIIVWGDHTRRSILTGRRATQPFGHVYRHRGTFRVRVTIIDAAGNATKLRTTIRVF